MTRKIIIMGAAGRDFHVYNCCYRDDSEVQVVAFTAAQIPHIEDRRYPASIAGSQYPDGIPIYPEEDLLDLLNNNDVDEVVFAYSDITLSYVDERRKELRPPAQLSPLSMWTQQCCHPTNRLSQLRRCGPAVARARLHAASHTF